MISMHSIKDIIPKIDRKLEVISDKICGIPTYPNCKECNRTGKHSCKRHINCEKKDDERIITWR
jgi:hypothetical protein